MKKTIVQDRLPEARGLVFGLILSGCFWATTVLITVAAAAALSH